MPSETKPVVELKYNEPSLGVPDASVNLEDIFGNLGMVTTTPTWTPKKFIDGLALDSTTGKVYYYDFTNKVWKSIGGSSHRSVVSITTAASYTLDTDSYNAISITALAGALNTLSASGTPSNFDSLIVRILDNGSAQTLAFDATKYIAKGISLPSTTVAGKCMTLGFLYDSVVGKWGLVALSQE